MWSVKRKAARGDGELWWECCDAFWKLQWELSAFVIVLMHFQDWEGSGFFFFCASVHMNSCKWRSINFAWASIKPTLFDPVDCAACAWLYFCVRVCALDLNFGPRALHYVPPRIVRHPTLHRRLCSPARRLHNAIQCTGTPSQYVIPVQKLRVGRGEAGWAACTKTKIFLSQHQPWVWAKDFWTAREHIVWNVLPCVKCHSLFNSTNCCCERVGSFALLFNFPANLSWCFRFSPLICISFWYVFYVD